MPLIKAGEWQPLGVAELEDRAWDALRETDRSVCVTAGAGAGKTEFLAQKAAYLLQTGLCLNPKRILAISFKRDAADTLAKRVRLRCGDDLARRFVSMTFDAFTKSLVDQFRNALPEHYRPPFDYEVAFSTGRQLDDLMRRANVTGINADQLSRAIAQVPIPIADQNIKDEYKAALEAYWEVQYRGGERTYLTFPMMNRLAEYLVRENEHIRAALCSTYSAVFLDEFQDTTIAQFSFLMSAFGTDSVVYTAVGDDKQRIMGWAGAMKNAFDTFAERCAAVRVSLLLNWRSHEDLVAIQYLIARELDPEVEHPVARRNRTVDGNVCAIWRFDTKEQELEELSAWIESEIEAGLPPENLAILVRMKADDVEQELAPILAEHNVVLRNLARMVGEISIQEVLVEELTEAVLPFMKLGYSRRNPEAWADAQDQIRLLNSVDDDDDVALQKLNSRTESIAKAVRVFMRENDPAPDTVRGLLRLIMDAIGIAAIRAATPAYQRHGEFDRVYDGLSTLLAECAEEAADWSGMIDRLTGKGQVPLMTIHKSKGMEFHTMIFLGFDQGWWSLKPQANEEISSFFVAFTRAEQRAFFCSCQQRGARIAWLEDILGDAVQRLNGTG